MKKFINKNILFGFIIGLLVMGIAGVSAATLYYSNEVSYTPSDTSWNVDNVEKALNALYEKTFEIETLKSLGDATENDIAVGKTALVKGNLITGKATIKKNITIYTSSQAQSTYVNNGYATMLFDIGTGHTLFEDIFPVFNGMYIKSRNSKVLPVHNNSYSYNSETGVLTINQQIYSSNSGFMTNWIAYTVYVIE